VRCRIKRRSLKKASRKPLIFAALVGFVLVVVTVCAALWLYRSDPDVPLNGTWKGTFDFDIMNNIACTYRFNPDGTFVDEHVDPDTGVLVRATGHYTQAGGQVRIRWENGGFERATVRRTGDNSIEYVIVAHSDRAQVGGRATFSRLGR
jgi:hypothetical protein